MFRIISAAILISLLAACNNSEEPHSAQVSTYTEDGFDGFSAKRMGENIAILASDSFEGRKPFTIGEKKTVDFLKRNFESVGLQPGNGDSYVQEVPMVNIATVADSVMNVKSKKGDFTLKGFDDYVIWTEKTDPKISIQDAPIVFAGYGVNAPERNWNDYAELDVKGKIVMVMVNDPGFGVDSSLFRGDTMTYYGRWTYKFEEAARQGALGCLVIHNTKAASYPFSVVQNNWNGSRLHLDDRGTNKKYCDVVGWISSDAALKLLAAGGYDSTILRKASEKTFKAVALNTTVSTSIKVDATFSKSYNVIGKITGSKHPDEYIIYTAHWDHLGIGKPDEKGDSIYNGAYDNASGTAGLIELAHAFKSMKTPPKRTIVFLAVTAEEQGLWGSAYYAQHPVYPANKTLANINMDEVNKLGATKEIKIVGRGQSDLEDTLKLVAEKMGRTISFEERPGAGSYYRSDHFNFAKAGIPALQTEPGVEVIGKDKDYGVKKSEEYTIEHYHRPSDQYLNDWDLNGCIEDLKLFFMVGKRVDAGEKWPGWKDASEFKPLRKL